MQRQFFQTNFNFITGKFQKIREHIIDNIYILYNYHKNKNLTRQSFYFRLTCNKIDAIRTLLFI